MRKYVLLALAAIIASALFVPAATTGSTSTKATYLVVYAKGVSASDARASIRRLGGTILREDGRLATRRW
jgi:hypothetical protein